ncbi:multiple epidermal growth factor-like domains protein 10 isoform X2 [Patella vulgata]|uniref:multiple epidermal growth factor-like domains protein 10 isoform X2 n=1 Tax=Patella vulgata TaxID=6465 RepID=UPI0024A9D95C|nr:multiple epidermal growth factor-like domains protein 10 isoform X2 [Patella vulgata]
MRSCGVCTVTNVAYNKPTNQSSTYTDSDHGEAISAPSRAVDSNLGQVWGSTTSSCTHTLHGSPSWWCVDLQQVYNIDSFKLFNRDILQGRLSGFELKISSVGQCNESGFISATSCYKDTPPTTQDIYTIDRCNQQQSLSARTVFVRVNNDEVVSLCEVQIFTVQCNTGYYSTSSSTCQPCDKCLNNTCDATTGVCTDGCKDGYYDDKCTSPCSDKCTNSRCYTNPSFSQPQCTDGCVGGYKGSYCQTSCPGNCRSCQQDGSSCIECNQGWYGTNCESQCPDNCVGGCGKMDGRCTDCKPDTAGSYCNITCGTGCQPTTNLTTCDRNGRCTNCIVGRHGDRCDKNCSTGCDGGCDRTGRCTTCIIGRYGNGCDINCSTGCDGGCNRDGGKCTSCIKGKTGDRCDVNCNNNCTVCNQDNANSCTECKDGRWGSPCSKLCNTNCKPVVGKTVGKCDITSGLCTDGCKTGLYSIDCNKDCPSNCKDGLCDQKSGDCIDGSLPDKTGCNCSAEKIVEGTSISPIVSGIIGVLCGIVGTVAVGVSYHFYKKRRQSSQPKAENDPDYVYSNTDLNPTTSTTDDTLTTGYQNIPTNTRNVDYVNQSFNTEDNTRNMYDTLDLTPDNTQHTYTTLGSNKVHKAKH